MKISGFANIEKEHESRFLGMCFGDEACQEQKAIRQKARAENKAARQQAEQDCMAAGGTECNATNNTLGAIGDLLGSVSEMQLVQNACFGDESCQRTREANIQFQTTLNEIRLREIELEKQNQEGFTAKALTIGGLVILALIMLIVLSKNLLK